jgi:hypothetical protein|tara:strand:+ start:704 stop:1057 length:354 start_codon:yes stop_codon:yes gene_type:complete
MRIFLLSALFLNISFLLPAYSAQTTTEMCQNAMYEVTSQAVGIRAEKSLHAKDLIEWINKNYSHLVLRSFLVDRWVPKLVSDEDFNSNSLWAEQSAYVKECANTFAKDQYSGSDTPF